MAFLTCNGFPVTSGVVEVPRSGAWTAALRLDADTAPTGSVSLVWDGAPSPWRGTVARGGVLVEGGPCEVLVVGGAGGLGRALPGQSYRQASLRLVVGQLLTAAGELLAGAVLPAVLDRQVARWSRQAGPAGAQLEALVRAQGLTWRVTPGGQVWIGVEAGAPLVLPQDAQITRRRPGLAQVELTTAEPWALATGGVFEGSRVAVLTHHLSATALRTTITAT